MKNPGPFGRNLLHRLLELALRRKAEKNFMLLQDNDVPATGADAGGATGHTRAFAPATHDNQPAAL
jgi:hypothetical protein